MPVSQAQSQLRKVLDFSPEELNANKNGRTTRKKSFSAPWAEFGIPGVWLAILIFSLLAVAEWIFDWLPISPWLIFLTGLFLAPALIILAWKRRSSLDVKGARSEVIPAEGVWRLHETRRRKKPRLEVGSIRFRLKKEQASQLQQLFDQYDGIGGVVYHRPGSRTILSAQVVDVAWKNSNSPEETDPQTRSRVSDASPS